MGFGIMQYWVNGKVCVDDKIKMANILLKTNLPLFHFGGKRSSLKKCPIFSKVVEFPRH